MKMANKQTDICTCGHSRAAHFELGTQGCINGDCICAAFDKVDPLREAAPEMYVALAKLICPACEHELQHHTAKSGCEIERGDGYRHAEFKEALGPCGCNDDDLRDDSPDFVRALESFRKAKGECPCPTTNAFAGKN